MKPEKRSRKKAEVFDPHTPGTKHQMMALRSRMVKEKKQKVKNRDRMRKIREKEKEDKKKTPKKKKNVSKS